MVKSGLEHYERICLGKIGCPLAITMALTLRNTSQRNWGRWGKADDCSHYPSIICRSRGEICPASPKLLQSCTTTSPRNDHEMGHRPKRDYKRNKYPHDKGSSVKSLRGSSLRRFGSGTRKVCLLNVNSAQPMGLTRQIERAH